MVFPRIYSFISFTSGRSNFSNLIQHRHHLIQLFLSDGKGRNEAKYRFRCAVEKNTSLSCFVHDVIAFVQAGVEFVVISELCLLYLYVFILELVTHKRGPKCRRVEEPSASPNNRGYSAGTSSQRSCETSACRTLGN